MMANTGKYGIILEGVRKNLLHPCFAHSIASRVGFLNPGSNKSDTDLNIAKQQHKKSIKSKKRV